MDTHRRPDELRNVREIHESLGDVGQRLKREKSDKETQGGTYSTLFLAVRFEPKSPCIWQMQADSDNTRPLPTHTLLHPLLKVALSHIVTFLF